MRRRPDGRFPKVRKWWRCSECGAQFAAPEPGCREHPKVLMLEWTPTLAAAYRTQLERSERGEPPETHEGLLGATYSVAARLVAKMGREATSDER